MLKKALTKMFNLEGCSNPSGVGGVAPKSYPWNYWQKGMKVEDVATNPTVEACVATISQTIAMLPIYHKRVSDKSGEVRVKKSLPVQTLYKPNPFQTKSEFMVDLVRNMLLEGNGYGVVKRDNSYRIKYIYPQSKMSPYVSYDNEDVYYSGVSSDLIRLEDMIPSRDVLHIKMHTTTHPLRGVTPLVAATISASSGNSIQGHINRFFQNMSRPSGVLSTDMTLSPDQTLELRARFNKLSQDLNTGGLPILSSGLKYLPVSMSAVDAEIIETYKMTKSDICSVFRVPPALIGDMEKATFANTEALMKFWVSSGLGFIIEHLENSLNKLFNLPLNESIEFDTNFLLQADFKGRMDGYKVAVTGGFMTPNEARKKENLKPLEGGDDLYMQMQNVPLELTGQKLQSDIDKVDQEVELLKNPPNTEVVEVIEEPQEVDKEITLALIKSKI